MTLEQPSIQTSPEYIQEKIDWLLSELRRPETSNKEVEHIAHELKRLRDLQNKFG